MAGMTMKDFGLADVRRRANELVSAADSLANLFEEGATLMRRQDQVARLKEFHSAIRQRVEQLRKAERAASTARGAAGLLGSLVWLGAGLITMASEDETMQAVSRQLLDGPPDREHPCGTVVVCVGPGGVPEEVDAVSISSLAREAGKDEGQVRNVLLAHGYSLLNDDVFFRLIDNLAGQILNGKLSLPVSAERLGQLQEERPLLPHDPDSET
ncbi:MAG: hypothetical protein HYX90_04385 [Chloroflexi bacterium]|nr:hypothetical protein [Chloroflexota bacterium]